MKQEKDKKYAIISIIVSMVTVALWVFLFIAYYPKTFNSTLSSIAIGLGYYQTLGIPFAIISIITGIIGLKTKLRSLAIVSLVLRAIELFAIIVILINN